MSQSALRGPSTMNLFSLLISRLKKQKGPVVLADCAATGGRREASLGRFEPTLNLIGLDKTHKTHNQFNPLFLVWLVCPRVCPAAECSSFHQVAPLVFTVYGLSSSACLIPLVRINTCFKLLVNKTEHRYECVIKR